MKSYYNQLFKMAETKKSTLNPNAKEFIPQIEYEKYEEKSIFEGKMLKIKYEIDVSSHDGYCSDPYNITKSTHFEFDIKNLPDNLKNEDYFDDHFRLKEEFRSLLKTQSSLHGNGYCGCKTIRYPVSAKLISSSRIRLGTRYDKARNHYE